MGRNRRQFLGGLGTVSVIAAAGCRSSTEDETTSTATATSTTPSGLPSAYSTTLLPDDGDLRDQFGTAVSVSADGDTVLVGAWAADRPHGLYGGRAYVFRSVAGTWQEWTPLVAADGAAGDKFGAAVALSADGTTAVVGAPNHEAPHGRGAVYVFETAGDGWYHRTTLHSNVDRVDLFGGTVAVSADGSTVVVGAHRDERNGESAGAAYVFTTADGSITRTATLSPEDADEYDEFGYAVAVSDDGTTVFVGAKGANRPVGTSRGAAYVFRGDDWHQTAKLTSEDGTAVDSLGTAVAVSADGTTAIVGAEGDTPPPGGGSAAVFTATGSTWSHQTTLRADEPEQSAYFGNSVAMSDDGTVAIVGAPYDGTATGSDSGSAAVFAAVDGSWTRHATLTPETAETGDLFGATVAVGGDGTTAFIGAPHDDPDGPVSGSVSIFE